MGRWDALKPGPDDDHETTKKKKPVGSSSSSSRPQKPVPRSWNPHLADQSLSMRTGIPPKQQPSFYSRWKPRKQNDPEKRQENLQEHGKTESLQILLSRQLDYYQTKSKDFDADKLEKAMEEIEASSKVIRESVSLLLLVNLLEVDKDMIRGKVLDHIHQRLMLQDSKVKVDKGEAIKCMEGLVRFWKSNHASHRSMTVVCLCRLASSQAKRLPAEDTAHKVVGPILLPALQIGDEKIQTTVCDTLEALLPHPPFASALLAPLVQDVSAEGKEQTVASPIRRDLFQSLQSILFSETTSTRLQTKLCTTLACTIETLPKTEEKANLTAIPIDLNAPALERFIIQNLESSLPLHQPSLVVLRALLRTYPKVMTKFGSQLLFPSPTASQNYPGRERKCIHCSCHLSALSPFLRSAHDTVTAGESSQLTLSCTANLVRVLPWDLWLKQRRQSQSAASGFYRKVADSLMRIVQIARCAVLKSRKTKWEDALGRLCTTLFGDIPWDDNYLVKAGEDLWETLAASYLDPSTSLPYKSAVVAVLIASMGGRETPQGDLPPMALPVQKYLYTKTTSGAALVQQIMQDLRSRNSSTSTSSLELFCAMLRTRPETALPLWEEFRDFLATAAHGDTNSRGVCLRLLESFLLGRRDFPSHTLRDLEEAHLISVWVFELLETIRAESNAKNRTRILNAYEALLPSDWDYLRCDEHDLMGHFHGIIQQCADPKADVRRGACKAIGEFCSQYLTNQTLSEEDNESSVTASITDQICTAMIIVVKDEKNATTRSMAVFALGNLALAMTDHDVIELVDFQTIVDITGSIHDLLDDPNDKVAGNAIRSVGHWGSILASRIGKDQSNLQHLKCLVSAIQGLSFRVGRTLALASPEQQAQMSWKERSAAKKHGWGACYSLGRILGSIHDCNEGSDLEESVSNAVKQLVQCLTQSALLSEKVVLAAMVALRAIKPLVLVGVTGKSGLIGETLVVCCLVLLSQQQQISNPKFVDESARLLSHFLSCASISDVVIVLKHEETSKATLESLYRWMVENELEGRAFEIFALGMLRPGLVHDVSLEQRFASRAMMQYKKEQSISLNSGDVEDDGGDEL